MTTSTPSDCTDSDLIDKVLDLIPDETWHLVLPALVGSIVDAMTSDILTQLTNDPNGFERAEEILTDYYKGSDQKHSLIQDAFKILGSENTLYLLDALQLDKYMEYKQLNQVETND